MPQIPFYAREWREFRGLKLAEAARQADMKISHLSAIEDRSFHFTEHDLAALANAYTINPVMLLGLNPADPRDRADLERMIAAANDVDEEDDR